MRLLLLFVAANMFLLSKGLEKPRLHVVEDYDSETGENPWKRVNNRTGILSRSKDTLELFCTASYPVQWKITGFVDPMDQVTFQPARRFIRENFDIFEIRVIVFFYDDSASSSWFECQSVADPSLLHERLAVFVPGSRSFVKNINNNNVHNSLSIQDTLTIPCGVTDPALSVQIQVFHGNKVHPVKGTYDHVDGFTLERPISGTYMCQTAEKEKLNVVLTFSDQADVYPKGTSLMSFITGNITLKCSSRSEQASIRITGDADVVYTETEPNSKSLLLFAKKALEGTVTCSLGNVEHVWNYKFIEPPRVHTDNFEGEASCITGESERAIATVRCKSPEDCQFQKQCFGEEGIKCNMDQLNYFENRKARRCWLEEEGRGAYCASIPFYHHNGLIECRVGPLTTLTQFFLSLKMRRYTDWREAPKEELLRMEKIFRPDSPSTFFCEATSFLFADSLKFQLEYENGTRRFVEDSLVKNPSREDERKIDDFNVLGVLTMEVPSGVVGVHCLAPWWNSTAYMSIGTRL